MSLDKIQLPDFLIPSFFKDNLVITREDITQRVTEKPATIKQELPVNNQTVATPVSKTLYLGGNKKQISIIVKDDTSVYLKDEWLQLLTSILGACKLTIDDVAIINHTKTPVLYAALVAETTPSYILLFNVTSNDITLPFTGPHYQVQDFNSAKVLLCPSLSLMIGTTEEVKQEKTKLWMSLKKMFNI